MTGLPLRVGIVGAGQVAQRHADAYARSSDAALVAVADVDVDRAAALARPYGARPFGSYDDLLAAGIDAISVCVPHDLHLPIALAAADARVHMLMEKPIANTLADADEMIAAAERAAVTMMIGFVHRFRTEALEAKRVIESGLLGEPATVLDRFCSLGGPHPPAWVWSRRRAGGGVLMYGGIHSVDRIMWLLEAAVVRVYGRAHHSGGYGDVEDGVVAMLELDNGATATIFENSPPYGNPGGWSTDVFGSRGAIRIQTGEWLEVTSVKQSFKLTAADDGHFDREIAEFVAAVRERRGPSIPASAGRASLAVALAIYESAATRAPVDTGALRS